MSMFSLLILIALLTGFIVADAILDYIFVIVYAALAFWAAERIVHLMRYYKKYGEMDTEDVRFILLYIALAIGAAILQFTVL